MSSLDQAFALQQQNNVNSPLLALPQELRDQVLSYVVPIHEMTRVYNDEGPLNVKEHAIFRTCHQLRRDASLIFFHKNIFVFNTAHQRSYDLTVDPKLDRWIKDVVGEYLPLLRALQIYQWGVLPWETSDSVASMSLKEEAMARRKAALADERLGMRKGTTWLWSIWGKSGTAYINAVGQKC